MNRIARQDYAFVFADIEGIRQLPWASVAALKASGHQSIDFYMLFPLRQSIQRLMSFTPAQLDRIAPVANRFFGTTQWRALVDLRSSSAQTNVFLRDIEALYLTQMETLWTKAKVVRTINSTGNRCLYKMLFASNHPVATRLVDWEGGSQQFGLGI